METYGLLAQAESGDNILVPLRVTLAQVNQVAPPLAYHFQETAP